MNGRESRGSPLPVPDVVCQEYFKRTRGDWRLIQAFWISATSAAKARASSSQPIIHVYALAKPSDLDQIKHILRLTDTNHRHVFVHIDHNPLKCFKPPLKYACVSRQHGHFSSLSSHSHILNVLSHISVPKAPSLRSTKPKFIPFRSDCFYTRYDVIQNSAHLHHQIRKHTLAWACLTLSNGSDRVLHAQTCLSWQAF